MLRHRIFSRRRLTDSSGFTLIELLVAMAASIVVIGALLTILEVSLAQSTKIANETYADQLGRTAMAKLVGEMHNACIHSEFKPVQEESGKEKTGENVLTFVNTGSKEAAPEAKETYEHRIVWKTEAGSSTSGTLTEYVATFAHGTWPEFTEPGTESKVLLASHVSKAASHTIFTYYKYSEESSLKNGALTKIALTSGALPAKAAAEVAAVEINFVAAGSSDPSSLERSVRPVQPRDLRLQRAQPGNADQRRAVSMNGRRHLRLRRPLGHMRADAGFAMMVAIGVMFVSSLLVVAAFTAAQGDIGLSHRDSTSKQAYYAALAGIQDYEYQLEANPDYWESCEEPSATVSESTKASYKVAPMPVEAKCSKSSPFTSMIQKTGAAAGTFRIQSTGTAGASTSSIVATFQVKGFLNFVYFTQFEDEDPGLYNAPKECEGTYYSERKNAKCETIVFVTGDKINGPMHTDDAPAMCGAPTFGRPEHTPYDVVEFGEEPYSYNCSEGLKPVYYTAPPKSSYTLDKTPMVPPTSDESLGKYVKEESSSDEFEGLTHIVMNGTANTLEVTKSNGEKESLAWPVNGLIYVRTSSTCATFKPTESDTSTEEAETGCGNVYVSGTYSKSLTIGAQNDVIVNGEIYPTSVAGKLGSEPTGTEALGLIANNYVRIYHPLEKNCEEIYNYHTKRYEETCSGTKNGKALLKNPWIYAAILSTKHSFVVDNYNEGEALGDLNIYGAIAQDYRGIVGTTGTNGVTTGYIKDYEYDERLAVDEPPYFLSPLNSGWKVVRETSPTKE